MGFAENMLKNLDKRQEAAKQAERKEAPLSSPEGDSSESIEVPSGAVGGASPSVGRAKDGIYEKESTDVIRMVDICQAFDKSDGSKFVLFDHFNLTISDFKGQGQFISIIRIALQNYCFFLIYARKNTKKNHFFEKKFCQSKKKQYLCTRKGV